MSVTGWLANVLLVAGLWYMGRRKWWAFALTVVGEVVWVGLAASRGQWDLAAICLIFTILAGWNLVQWRRDRSAAGPPDDPLSALNNWCRKGYVFTITCGGFCRPGDGVSVTLEAGGRKVCVSDSDESAAELISVGDVIREALDRWHADRSLKVFRFWLRNPPDEFNATVVSFPDKVYTLDVTASSEQAAWERLRELYAGVGKPMPADVHVPCYEQGPAAGVIPNIVSGENS